MRLILRLALLLLAAAAPSAASIAARPPVTILVSIDGFRPDYLARGATPRLNALAAAGASGPMRPSFPSKTFPNHWTLVTGLVPDHHGIVANAMEDAARPGETFTMSTDDPFWWSAAEPIWVAAERAGLRSATMFWPGANVAIGGHDTGSHHLVAGGTRPDDWQQFNQAVTSHQRVTAVIDWMRRPPATRPRFVTLYFDAVDTAGHDHGPAAPEMLPALREVDGAIGELIDQLHALRQSANLVIVADHGMAATSDTRTIPIADLADPGDLRLFESGPYAAIYAVPGHEAALERRLLGHHAHVDCWRKSEIPARFRYGTNPRIPPYLCLAEPRWLIVAKPPAKPFSEGNHGYDNQAPDMRALFIADGPAFHSGIRLAAFDNVDVDVYPLLRRLLGLPPKAGLDGTIAPLLPALRR